MVHYHRYNLLKKGEYHAQEEDMEAFGLVWASSGYYKRKRPKLVSLLILSLLCCCLILAPHLFCSSSPISLLYSFVVESDGVVAGFDVNASLCSSISNGTMCCDRRSIRSDVCVMKGDVRTHSVSSSVFLYTSRNISTLIGDSDEFQHEKIKPYTRKWEKSVMDTIDQLDLVSKQEKSAIDHRCDVKHEVPAVFFSTGGYTGNVYHEFNDGILPLYITSQHFKKKVVFVILEYHTWWIMKYGDILSHLSDYPAIDFSTDKRIHCFPEAIVGLRIHDELAMDPSLVSGNKSIVDFHNLLDKAYRPRIKSLIRAETEREVAQKKPKQKVLALPPSSETLLEFKEDVQELKLKRRPKLVIVSRNASRAITNEDLLVKMAEKIGFRVEVLKPGPTTELARIYWALNSSDVMIGVHGAAMTHFLFMKPGSVFIQVIPLGTEWAADAYYGEPARKLGLKYIGYQIAPTESSLYDKYDRNDPVLQDPPSIANKGWEYTKTIYLDSQNVILNLGRFQKRLVRAYRYSIRNTNDSFRLRSH
ncbi:xylan glycosyltransferase MUCI21-like [Mercurialis annua]|uniref:xylan glycosyltransferase MUCI21-like n=1 Tax=Mercurialis annua TaxID=3986 RepID=UPI002160A2E9|nr:xylan glycosyltransferase MUCI21-like [Mercurialis annua]